MQLHACIDAQSVFAAIPAEEVRMPTERHTLHHAQWARALLGKRLLEHRWWAGARDYCADGLNKTSVPRNAIVAFARGEWRLKHEPRPWPARPDNTAKTRAGAP